MIRVMPVIIDHAIMMIRVMIMIRVMPVGALIMIIIESRR
jgi:hypothetical protein